MFLIDTNVISEIRKGIRAHPAVRTWFQNHAAQAHYLSVLTVGEIRKGIEQVHAKDPAKAAVFNKSLSEVMSIFEGRILGIGLNEAEIWGRLSSAGKLPEVDGLIAATALSHGLTIVTRNVRDFDRSGAKVVNPWESIE